jgi:hypothetical protein
MISQTDYTLFKEDAEHIITITPLIEHVPGGALYLTGVYRLSEGRVGLGELVFDDDMNQWEYTGMGDLTHEEAAEIATFIQANSDDLPDDEPL